MRNKFITLFTVLSLVFEVFGTFAVFAYETTETEEFHDNIDSVNTYEGDTVLGSIEVSIVNENIQISIDNAIAEFKDLPFIDENGRLQVPVRELCEFLNKRVYWFENPNRVMISTVPADPHISAGGDSITFIIGENQYEINGKEYPMDTSARIVNNRAYIPLRIAGEFLKYEVIWQE